MWLNVYFQGTWKMKNVIQWNFNLQKPYYTKDSEYEWGFEEISIPFFIS